MNILIVEDDVIQRQCLRKIIEGIRKNIVIYESDSKEGALEISKKVLIELFYVDIKLNNSSGLDLALELRKFPQYEFSWIIFLTTHMEYLLQAFKEIHCYDYILKPYDKEAILNMSKKLINYQKEKSETKRKYVIFDIEPGFSTKLYIDEILFVEVKGRTCTIHSKSGSLEIRGLKLKEALETINCDHIVQCHKSYIVNSKEIRRIHKVGLKSYEIYFENYHEKALLSYNFKDEIMERFKG